MGLPSSSFFFLLPSSSFFFLLLPPSSFFFLLLLSSFFFLLLPSSNSVEKQRVINAKPTGKHAKMPQTKFTKKLELCGNENVVKRTRTSKRTAGMDSRGPFQ